MFDLVEDFDIRIASDDGQHLHHFSAKAHTIQSDFGSFPKWAKPLFPDAVIFSRALYLHDMLYKFGWVGKVIADAIAKGVLIDLGDAGEVCAEIVFIVLHVAGGKAWKSHRKNDPPASDS